MSPRKQTLSAGFVDPSQESPGAIVPGPRHELLRRPFLEDDTLVEHDEPVPADRYPDIARIAPRFVRLDDPQNFVTAVRMVIDQIRRRADGEQAH